MNSSPDPADSSSEWVLDSLVGFLKGPLWTQPLFAFLDEKSVIFDPEDDGSNDKEYQIVFQEYKDYVGKLLESHMTDLGISPVQFETACEEAEGVLSRKFHQALFEQIWAANDFTAFKRMMIQINIDLQLWALEILASKYGKVPRSFLPEGVNHHDFLTGDDFFLREAKRRSLADIDVEEVSRQLTQVKVSVERPPLTIMPGLNASHDKSPEEEKVLEQLHGDQNATELSDPFAADSSNSAIKTEVHKMDINVPRKLVKFSSEEVSSSQSTVPLRRLPDEKMDAEEIKHRQDYLRRQRDKLLGLKKEERDKQVARLDRLEKSGRRPRTAKFIATEEANAGVEDKKDKTRAYMRSLAARIKAEVLDTEVDDDKK